MQVGNAVECRHDVEWQERHQRSDAKKADRLGKRMPFMGNAAAYMHLDEAYVVEAITSTGGLVLRGFSAPVSLNDVQLSTKPIFR